MRDLRSYLEIEKEGDLYFDNRDLIVAAFTYTRALKKARYSQNSKLDVKRIKNKIVKTNRLSLKDGRKYYKQIQFRHTFTEDQIKHFDKVINKITDRTNLNDILKLIGNSSDLGSLYNFNRIADQATKEIPFSMLFAANSTISREGNIIPKSQDGKFVWQMMLYELNLGFLLNIFLKRLFNIIINDHGLNEFFLLKYFRAKNLIDGDNLIFLEVAFQKFFVGDYITSLHLLIPQFENVFLKISEKLGLDIVSLGQSEESIITKTLSTNLLYSDEFMSKWGLDYCRLVGFILFEPLGLKLRHKVAHGEISVNECNYGNNILIIYLFLIMLIKVTTKRRRIKKA